MAAEAVLEITARKLHRAKQNEECSRVVRKIKKGSQVKVEELCISRKKVLWKKICPSEASLVKNEFSSEFPIDQAFWCQFDGEGSGNKLDCVCVVDCENLTLYSDSGAVYHISVPFKVKKVWPVSGGLLLERQVVPLTDVDNCSNTSTEDGLPVLFTLSHPLDDICPVTSRLGAESLCVPLCRPDDVNYMYDPQVSVLNTFTDPSLVVTYDCGHRCHAIWAVRSTELGDIPVQLPAMCRNLSSVLLQKTPQVMSSSAPEKYPPYLSGRGTPVMTPIQRLLFKTPGIFSPTQPSPSDSQQQTTPLEDRGSASNLPLSPRNPLAERLNSGTRVSQRLRSAVRIGSGRTPMKMRLSGRIARDIDRELLSDRKAKSYSPVRSSPIRPHYSRSWSTVFCDPIVSDDNILDSMGDPLLPEICMELLWQEDQTTNMDGGPAGNVFITCDVNGRKYIVSVVESAAVIKLLECQIEDDMNLVSIARESHEISGVMAVPVEGLNLMVVKQSDGKLCMFSGHHMVGQLLVRRNDAGVIGDVVKMTNEFERKITFILSSDESFCCEIPPVTSSSLVQLCLNSLQSVLPPDTAEQIIHKFYMWKAQALQHTSSGEWAVFSQWILATLQITQQSEQVQDPGISESTAQVPLLKAFAGTSAMRFVGKLKQHGDHPAVSHTPSCVPDLVSVAGDVLIALHLIYEEMKLNIGHSEDVKQLRLFLYSVCKCFAWTTYMDLYFRDHPEVYFQCSALQCDHAVLKPPSEVVPFTDWLKALVEGSKVKPFPVIPIVTKRLLIVAELYSLCVWPPSTALHLENVVKPLTKESDLRIANWFQKKRMFEEIQGDHISPAERVVSLLAQEKSAATVLLKTLPFGVGLLLWDCVIACRQQPSPRWPTEVYSVIGREDIAKSSESTSTAQLPTTSNVERDKGDTDGMDMDHEVLKHMFKEDLRINEVKRCLQSSEPVKITLEQKPEVSDHDFLEQQEEHLLLVAQRTMALPVARGMFTLGTVHPIPVTHFPFPPLDVTGRAHMKNATIAFEHISVPDNMMHWPTFHNGVAAGLRITPQLSKMDSTWIMSNLKEKDQSTSITEAGFLMGLGLNGHLRDLPETDLCNLLSQRSGLCTTGLLLGMSASRCGSCDPRLSSLVAIHIRSLLPPGSADMDIPHHVEIASIASLGLLHMESANRHFADTMLKEIACVPGPEMEDALDRESHALAAGLSLGMITLGLGGTSPNISDLGLVDKLLVYIDGGPKSSVLEGSERHRTPSQLILEGEQVNTHVTAPGAILALGLAFIKSGLNDVAKGISVPTTYVELLKIRPDFHLLRVMAYRLILWNSITPSVEWVESHVPDIVRKWSFRTENTNNMDIQAMSQAMVNILSGACFAIGLKYAGTANKQAHRVLMQFVRDFLSMLGSTPSVEMAGKPCLYRCLCSLLVCAAMVMSGTGDLEVFRVVRQLRERVASGDMNYGNFMAIHMALGLLFLGGCTRALCDSSRAVAVLVAAFYPIYPASSVCNRYHLQALRHLYVLATSSRILLARNVETGTISSVPIRITTKNEHGKTDTHQLTLPSVMTNWDTIQSIEVVGERCWTFTLQVTPELRKKLVYSGTIYVKDRIGYFSYEDDPEGQQSSLSIALLNGYQDHSSFSSVGHGFVDIHELSKNPFVKTFASCVCPTAGGGVSEEASIQRFYNSALTECVLKEKLDLLPSYVTLEKLSLRIHSSTPADLKQFGLMRAYSTTCANRGSEAVISCQFLLTQETRLKFLLEEAEARLDPSTSTAHDCVRIPYHTAQNGFLSSDLDSLLKWYMLNSSPPPQSTAEAVLLGCLLSMYSIPPPHHLPITAQTSCQDVYEALKDVHLPPAAVLRLLSLFTADLYQFLSQLNT